MAAAVAETGIEVECIPALGKIRSGAKARPAPVTMITRTPSPVSAFSKASISSSRMIGVKAFSFSGRFRVIVATRVYVVKDVLVGHS